MNSNLTDPAPVFVACIGLDWGDKSHALALHDPATPQTESATLTHSAENLHHWLDQLEARFGGRPVALAIEGTRGAIFPVLLERSWLHVFAVHPATSARYPVFRSSMEEKRIFRGRTAGIGQIEGADSPMRL